MRSVWKSLSPQKWMRVPSDALPYSPGGLISSAAVILGSTVSLLTFILLITTIFVFYRFISRTNHCYWDQRYV